jgi:proline iminopeptidase
LLHDPDAAVRERAARHWCDWEDAHVRTHPGRPGDARFEDAPFRLCFARLVTHYWRHAARIEDGALLAGVGRPSSSTAVALRGLISR